MSISRWIIAFAFGLTFIATVGAGAWAIWSLEKYYSDERDEIAEQHNSEAHRGIEACREIAYVFSASKCIRDAVAAAKEDSAAEKDLKAQQHMSLSALGVLIVSGITMFVTTVGVIFVYLTLRETSAGVLVMRNEQRPWVSVSARLETIYFKEASCHFDYEISLVNHGKSPAGDIGIFPHATFMTHMEDAANNVVEAMKRNPAPDGAKSILPGESLKFPFRAAFQRSKLPIDKTDEGKERLVPAIVVGVRYRAAFSRGNNPFTVFRVFVMHDETSGRQDKSLYLEDIPRDNWEFRSVQRGQTYAD